MKAEAIKRAINLLAAVVTEEDAEMKDLLEHLISLVPEEEKNSGVGYMFRNDIVTHVPTACLVEDIQGLRRALYRGDYESLREEVYTAIECLEDSIDDYTVVPAGLDIMPSGSSLVAMGQQSGIILNGGGTDILCRAGHPISNATRGGCIQCGGSCPFLSECFYEDVPRFGRILPMGMKPSDMGEEPTDDDIVAAMDRNSERNLTLAIDGPVAAGKTTQARELAKLLGLVYCDTGALYRAVAVGVCEQLGPDAAEKESFAEAVTELLPSLQVSIKSEARMQVTLLNGRDVTDQLRTETISKLASAISELPAVRTHLLSIQKDMADKGNVVMDGLDIGTVVMPNAKVKIYLTAGDERRAYRRHKELNDSSAIPYADMLRNVREWDKNDSRRAAAPLRQADDAVLVNNSFLSIEETTIKILRIIEEKLI